jgi:hypothetical protein
VAGRGGAAVTRTPRLLLLSRVSVATHS